MKVSVKFGHRIIAFLGLILVLFVALFTMAVGLENRALLAVALTGALITLAGSIYYSLTIVRQLNKLRKNLMELSRGQIPEVDRPGKGSDFLGIEHAFALYTRRVKELVSFSSRMAEGEMEENFHTAGEKDQMGNVLLALRESLLRQKEEERKRKEEDEQRNWSARGLAQFNNILRESGDDIAALSFSFIRELVYYIEAEAGGLYLVDQESIPDREKTLRLTGCYAFDREKHLHKEILFGEGLVGRAAVEEETIYMTDLPGEYLKIRSGLGEDLPVSLLLVPVIQSGEVLGVIELASFRPIPAYKRKFVSSLGESTGSVISKVYINLQTKKLLLQSRRQAEDLERRDEEMKRNMEELKKIQEQTSRREHELSVQLDELKKHLQG